MAESAIINTSIALYHYLCQNIVGTEKDVKAIRLMNNIRDNLQSSKETTIITSGSFGEGLLMRGSDFDVMEVVKLIEVCEDTHIDFNADKTYFSMELKDTQPGFTMLRLVHSPDWKTLKYCNEIGSDFYYSNLLFKQNFSTDTLSAVHGPCLSDDDGLYDIAYCLHSKSWITPAKQWVTRSNNSWPGYDIKQAIVKHGVLFVPVGVKGSTQEELEWRISFSVGEKLLINSFTHTQLLCYALMKILLKDVITLDIDCKELLCSYFIKTILFWICEELPLSIWKPENLIYCYMRCFRRLVYCVEYAFCPHYFIPENNLFENKIHGKAQKLLLNKLYILNSYGWQCFSFSDQLSDFDAFSLDISNETSYSYVKSVERLSDSHIYFCDVFHSTCDFLFEKVIYKVLSIKSSKIKYLFTYYLSKFCCNSEKLPPLQNMFCNKFSYKEYKSYISTLLLNTRHDSVSGWLVLASFCYKRKQYNAALTIIQYSLLKFTPEKFHQFKQFSDIHYELFNLQVIRNMPIVRLWKFFLLSVVIVDKSRLYPDEFKMKVTSVISSIVYAHFLRFLCHYHLQNSRQCLNSIKNLQSTIEENYSTSSECYEILGISCQLLGDKESARLAFRHSIKLFPDQERNGAFEHLSLIS